MNGSPKIVIGFGVCPQPILVYRMPNDLHPLPRSFTRYMLSTSGPCVDVVQFIDNWLKTILSEQRGGFARGGEERGRGRMDWAS